MWKERPGEGSSQATVSRKDTLPALAQHSWSRCRRCWAGKAIRFHQTVLWGGCLVPLLYTVTLQLQR